MLNSLAIFATYEAPLHRKNHSVIRETLRRALVWTQVGAAPRWVETSNDGWLRTAQRVDRKGPRAEMRGQSELLRGEGTQSTWPSYHNGNARLRSNRSPGLERQALTTPWLYCNPWQNWSCSHKRQFARAVTRYPPLTDDILGISDDSSDRLSASPCPLCAVR